MSSPSSAATQIVTVAALAAASFSVGYAFGARSLPLLPSVSQSSSEKSKSPVQDDEHAVSESDEEEGLADGDLSHVKAKIFEECKLVLVVRADLKMTTGKIAAQCGHATLACYKALAKGNPQLLQHWERRGQAKIALKASSEDELLELEAIAKSLNLCARSIQDAGRTQIAAGSRTVLGIGPGPVALINQVTGRLRLL